LAEELYEFAEDEDGAPEEDDVSEDDDADGDEFKEFVVSLLELNISLESAVSLEFALFISAAVLLVFAALISASLRCSIFRTLK
jgi:hypothetical protein